MKGNAKWGPLIDKITHTSQPISKAQLQNSQHDGVCDMEIAEGLYSFISLNLDAACYLNRERTAELGNGFELLRRYCIDCQGADQELRAAGKHRFFGFHGISDIRKLDKGLDEWEDLRRKWCHTLPDDDVYALLKDIVPVDMKLEIGTRIYELKTPAECLRWIRLRTRALKGHELLATEEKDHWRLQLCS